MLREYRAIRMQGGQETTGRPLALIRLTNAGSCPSRQRDCVAEPIRLANAAAPLLLRSQARRKAYRARSAETKGTAQLPLRGQVRRKETHPHHPSAPLPPLRGSSLTPAPPPMQIEFLHIFSNIQGQR